MNNNHPNRGKKRAYEKSPSVLDIKSERCRGGLTQAKAAGLIYSTQKTWEKWESGDNRMHPAFFELFSIKVQIMLDTLPLKEDNKLST